MRRTIATPWARELAGLCASCAQGRAAHAAAMTSRALSTGRTAPVSPQRAGTSPQQQGQPPRTRAVPQRRRWLSGSPAPRSPTQGASSSAPAGNEGGEEEGAKEAKQTDKTGHKPLPYYALFPQTLPQGAPPDGPFHIDVRALRREFLQLQAASHPDYHHSASETTTTDAETGATTTTNAKSDTRRRAEALSSHINSAYRTLASPLLRAQYVLAERHGVDLAGDEAAALSGPADLALLAEVMAAREEVDEAESEEDLEGPAAENEGRLRAAERALGEALERGDVQAAVAESVRLKYWENIRESIRNWEGGKPFVLEH